MYFQLVDNQVLSTQGQPDVNLHRLTAACPLYDRGIDAGLAVVAHAQRHGSIERAVAFRNQSLKPGAFKQGQAAPPHLERCGSSAVPQRLCDSTATFQSAPPQRRRELPHRARVAAAAARSPRCRGACSEHKVQVESMYLSLKVETKRFQARVSLHLPATARRRATPSSHRDVGVQVDI